MATHVRPAMPSDTDARPAIKHKERNKPATFPRQTEGYKLDTQMTQSLALDLLTERLCASIQAGDRDTAILLVAQLCERRVPLSITIAENKAPAEDKVSVKIFLEDYEKSVPLPSRKLQPSTTVYQLKQMGLCHQMQYEYGFSPDIQRCVIGTHLARDCQTLSQCGVNKSGATLYIYLTSNPQCTDRGQLTPADNIIIQSQTVLRVPPLPRAASQRTQGLNSLQPEEDISAGPEESVETEDKNPYELVEDPSPEEVGWKCVQCTFVNEPSRPGCEMCSAARPTSYVVPANCPLSDRERLRIEREQEVERLSQQAAQMSLSSQPAAPAPHQSTGTIIPGGLPPGHAAVSTHLSTVQLDLLLRLNDSYQEMRDRLDRGENIDDILARPELQDPKIVEELYKQYQMDTFQRHTMR